MLRRHQHRLIDIGTELFLLREMIPPLLAQADIRIGGINLDGSSSEMWRNIVTYVISNNKVDNLLQAMKFRNPGSHKLLDLEAELAQQSEVYLAKKMRDILLKRECVIFLGPRVFKYMDAGGFIPFNHHLSLKLAAHIAENEIYYDRNAECNLGYIVDRYESRSTYVCGDTEAFAKSAYEEAIQRRRLHDGIYRSVENLNFPLIINTNPDTLLDRTDNKDKFIHSWYDTSNNMHNVPIIPREYQDKTINYNIYGSFTNPFSILFSERETVDFTKNAYKESPPMPREIVDIVNKSYGLFIGFDFKEWHLKILFDVLDLKNKPGNYAICPTAEEIRESDLEYYYRQYNMNFVNADPGQFLINLSDNG